MVVATADRNIAVYNLANPQVCYIAYICHFFPYEVLKPIAMEVWPVEMSKVSPIDWK